MPTLAELPALAGRELGPTTWREMTQQRVNEFADVTEDHNYIHVESSGRSRRRSEARSRTAI